MASSASPDTSEVRRRGRQRLIGAIALVVVLVVFVPMILDSEPRPAREVPAAIPPQENAPPLPAATQAKAPAVASAPQPPAATASAAPAPQVPGTTPAAAPANPSPASATQPAASDTPRLEGFAVQVGAFRDQAKLKQAREKLVAAGVVHYTERVEGSSGPITRLRAGPFPTREAAEAAQAKLKRATLEGKVVPLP